MEELGEYIPWLLAAIVIGVLGWFALRSLGGGSANIDLGEGKPKANFKKEAEPQKPTVERVAAKKAKRASVEAEGGNATIKDVDISEAEDVTISAKTK